MASPSHAQIAVARLARAHKSSDLRAIAAARNALAQAHVLDAVERQAAELGADRVEALTALLTEGAGR